MRDFLSIKDQYSVIPIYHDEPIEEGAAADRDITTSKTRVDLGGPEETAKISDFDLLKVIGKGSFAKVRWGRVKGQMCPVPCNSASLFSCYLAQIKYLVEGASDNIVPVPTDVH